MQTNLTPCIDSIIELAVSYFKIMLKTALKHVTMRLMSFWQRLRSPELVQNRRTPGPGRACEFVTPPKVLPYFAHWFQYKKKLLYQHCSLTTET